LATKQRPMIEELLGYIKYFDPGFPHRVVGATGDEIGRLQELVGLPIPDSCKEFLRRMGRHDGGLDAASDATMAIDRVIDYYESWVVPGRQAIPKRCIVIGVDSPVMDVSLNLRQPGEPEVWFTEDEPYQLVSESLAHLLFRRAFFKYEPVVHPFRSVVGTKTYPSTPRLMDPARELALELGFVAEWFSDRIAFCGRRPNQVIFINQFDDTGIVIRVNAKSESEVAQSVSAILQRLPVELVSG
jgi:hypothetical protein